MYVIISIFHSLKFILYTNFWLKGWTTEVITEHDSSVNTNGPRTVYIKWSKDGLFSFLWHNTRKMSIGSWLPLINLQMDTAHV